MPDKEKQRIVEIYGENAITTEGGRVVRLSTKVELLPCNYSDWELFNHVLAHDGYSGYWHIDWQAASYARRYWKMKVDIWNKEIFIRAINMLNEHQSKMIEAEK